MFVTTPATLSDMLADAFIQLRQIAHVPAAIDFLDNIYCSLVPNEEIAAFDALLIEELAIGHSDIIRDALHKAVSMDDVCQILVETLTDDFYLTL